MRHWTIAAALLALAGCGKGDEAAKVNQVRAANPYSDQLKAMNDLYRNLGLYRAVRDGGQRCRKAVRGAYQQEYKNMAMWTVHCIDTGDWAIFIAPNGDVQARPCADAATIGIPACKVEAAAPAAPAAPAKPRPPAR